jgi:hypothetical protein
MPTSPHSSPSGAVPPPSPGATLPNPPVVARGGGHLDWRPIETAPLDGSPLLVYFPQIGTWRVFWSVNVFEHGSWCVSDNKFEDRPLRGWLTPPTHWMPLPEPPLD